MRRPDSRRPRTTQDAGRDRRGRGKRGGGRVICYFWTARDSCYLVFAYSKTDRGDLTAAQLKRLVEVLSEELSDG